MISFTAYSIYDIQLRPQTHNFLFLSLSPWEKGDPGEYTARRGMVKSLIHLSQLYIRGKYSSSKGQ